MENNPANYAVTDIAISHWKEKSYKTLTLPLYHDEDCSLNCSKYYLRFFTSQRSGWDSIITGRVLSESHVTLVLFTQFIVLLPSERERGIGR